MQLSCPPGEHQDEKRRRVGGRGGGEGGEAKSGVQMRKPMRLGATLGIPPTSNDI